jgi:hypothetical protein
VPAAYYDARRTSDASIDVTSVDQLPSHGIVGAADQDPQFRTAIDVATHLLGPATPENPATPWRRLLCNRTTFAMLVNAFCYSWGFYVLTSWLPTYFHQWDGTKEAIDPFLLLLVPYLAQVMFVCVID